MRSVKVGIVGLGGIAQLVHIPSLLSMDDVEITAACDINENLLRKVGLQYRLPSLYSDYAEMAEKSDVEAVFVLTKPHETHSVVASLFLENGKDVFCEKPMAMKLSDAEHMVKTAKKHGRILMIGFNRRYMPIFQRVKEKLKEDSKVEMVLSEVTSFMPGLRALFTGWIHSVDILRWFCGEPTKVQGFAKYKDPLYEECIVSIINFDSGACGVLLCNFNAGKYQERVEIHGEGISVNVNIPQTAEIVKGTKSYFEPTSSTVFTTSPWIKMTEEMGYQLQDKHFIECVKSGEKPATSGEDALNSHKLVNLIYRECGLPTLE
jgi:virulence factor